MNSLVEFGRAWLALGIAVGLHVIDEAAHHFLDWYNPIARRIRGKLFGLLFPPVFTFWPWFLALWAAVAAFLFLTPLAYQGRGWLVPVAIAVSLINIFNGLLHLVATVVLRRRVPGVLSAPFLLVASAWLLYAATHLSTRHS
ncbi:MAG TPA: HXXEE domain-containing protein [Gemmatimonadaceae bacterium]